MITKQTDFNLRGHNTFHIESKCQSYIEYTSADDLPEIASIVKDRKHLCIGQGSNLLFVGDYDGIVLHSRILDIEEVDCDNENSIRLRIGAGVEFDKLIETCVSADLWGIENLSGIPGEIGAAAVQNVGAYGVEACDVIKQVECYDLKQRCHMIFDVDQCDYNYRHSMFKNAHNHDRYIITHVTLELSRIPIPKIEYGSLKNIINKSNPSPSDIRNAVIKIRNEKLPLVDEIGSAGSFFKNPIVDRSVFEDICSRQTDPGSVPHYVVDGGVKIPAAWLIDQCGLKGYVHGNVAVWEKQPLVIVNHSGRASGADVVSLEELIISKVKSKFNIVLQPEVEHVGA